MSGERRGGKRGEKRGERREEKRERREERTEKREEKRERGGERGERYDPGPTSPKWFARGVSLSLHVRVTCVHSGSWLLSGFPFYLCNPNIYPTFPFLGCFRGVWVKGAHQI